MNYKATILPIPSSCTYSVPVLIGAADQLVTMREKSAKGYMINPHIRYWATWFLLKTFTTSGKIHSWNKQKENLLQYLRVSDGTLRKHIGQLKQLGLITIEKTSKRDNNISLISYKRAAEIMGITYKGEQSLTYKPNDYENETQVFRYLLTAQEITSNHELQLNELHRKYHKNLSGHTTEIQLLMKSIGTDLKQTEENKQYMQQQLLKLQKIVFRERSDMTAIAFSLRADINRSCKTWSAQHNYQSASSASYLKKKLVKLGAIEVEKVTVNSTQRSRIYIPGTDGKRKDGYKWNGRSLQTAWRLCDQVIVKHTPEEKPEKLQAAA